MAPKILLIDNRLDPPTGSEDLRRYLTPHGDVHVRRGPDRDLPASADRFSHVVISGSRASCLSKEGWVEDLLGFLRRAAESRVPTLGVCFGHQMLARAFGGIEAVRKSPTPEFGWVKIMNSAPKGSDAVMGPLPRDFYSFASHFEEVASLPGGFEVTASNQCCGIQAFRHRDIPVYGVQFHPERNVAEGDETFRSRVGKVPRGSLFNKGKGDSCFNESIPQTLFTSFLKVMR